LAPGSPDKTKKKQAAGTDCDGYIVVGMQDGDAYHRHLLPLTLEATRSPTPPLCGNDDARLAGRDDGGRAPGRGNRFTFQKEAKFGEDMGPKWWSPLLDNVIPPAASSTMKTEEGGRRPTAAGKVRDEGETATGKRGGTEKRKSGMVGATSADTVVMWENLDAKPMVLVHTFGSGNARGVKMCGHLFQSTFLFRSSDTGLRIRCISQEGSAGAPDADAPMLLPSEFCTQAQNHNKRPRSDILVDSLSGLPLKDVDETFLASLPRIRPLDAEGRPLQGGVDSLPKLKQRKLADGRACATTERQDDVQDILCHKCCAEGVVRLEDACAACIEEGASRRRGQRHRHSRSIEDEGWGAGAGGEGETPRKRDRLLRVGVRQVNYSEFAQDEERRQRQKAQQAAEESDSGSDDAAVAVRKRSAPKPSILTMGAQTPFVTAAASAAINLCNALHPSAFKLHFRPKAERTRWKRQVACASLSQVRNLVAELESHLLPSIWLFSYQSEVRGRLLAALAEATAAGVHQVVTIIAQNVCPSIFRYFTPTAKFQRRHVDWEEPAPGARMSRDGDGRDRHSADKLDRHRKSQKMLKMKNQVGQHVGSGGLAGVGGRGLIDKTRRSGDGRRPKPEALDRVEVREKRLRQLARFNRFQSAETTRVRKSAPDTSYGEAKRIAAATWRGMSDQEKARWEPTVSASARAGSVPDFKGGSNDTHLREHVSDNALPPESLRKRSKDTGKDTVPDAIFCGASIGGSAWSGGALQGASTHMRDDASENEEDEDEKRVKEERAGERKARPKNNARRRPVDQVCADTQQVGWLHVSLKCQQMHDRAQRTSCMRTLAHMREGVRMRARTSKRHAHKQLF